MEKDNCDQSRTKLIRKLLDRLSEVFDRPLTTSADYQYVASAITTRTGEYISPTTLKRIGGYLNESVATRRSTLDLLSRGLGYTDFADFSSHNSELYTDSDPSAGHWLDAATLHRGDMVELTWLPDRRCVVRFLGGDLWEVTESYATRLQPGQRFRCNFIIAGEPLQILLEPTVKTPRLVAYVCGRQRGVRFRRLL